LAQAILAQAILAQRRTTQVTSDILLILAHYMNCFIAVTLLSTFSAHGIAMQGNSRQFPWALREKDSHRNQHQLHGTSWTTNNPAQRFQPVRAPLANMASPKWQMIGDQNETQCVEDRDINTTTANMTAKDACTETSNLNDPSQHIIKFLQSYTAQRHGELIALSRPVVDKAQSFMCRGLAVGKGFDIKPKSSKIVGAANGFVPLCQACNWRNTTGGTGGSSPENDFTIGKESDFCRTHNKIVDGDKLCYATHRDARDGGLPTLQQYSHSIMVDNTKSKPDGVNGRRCLLIKMPPDQQNQQKSFPFFAYELKDQNKTVRPIVSDYDLLFLGECPLEDKTLEEKYPLFNADTDYFKPDSFPQLVKLALGLTCKEVLEDQSKSKNVIKAELFALLTRLTSTLPKQNIGLASVNVNLALQTLIDESENYTGGFRHGAENENYAAPQPFEDRVYPYFKIGVAVPKFENDGSQNLITGQAEVGAKYKELFAKGCCVPMNFNWLGKPFNTTLWKEVWIKSKDQALDGCPYYRNEDIKAVVDKYVELKQCTVPT